MHPSQLIGKLAIRTAPIDYGPSQSFSIGVVVAVNHDYSYSTEPIRIMAVTESHIVFKYPRPSIFGDKPYILNARWIDECWTDYEALLALASPEHIQRMQELSEIVLDTDTEQGA